MLTAAIQTLGQASARSILLNRLNRFLVGVVFFLCFVGGSFGQNWSTAHDFVGLDDLSRAIVATAGGRWISGGQVTVGGYETHGFLSALDAQGKVTWATRYPGSASVWSMDQAGEARFVVAGVAPSSGAESDDVCVFLVNATGRVLWSFLYGAEGNQSATSISRTNSGGYLVGGQTYDFSQSDMLVLKIDSQGKLIWHKVLGYPSASDSLRDLQHTHDGGAILVGWTYFGGDHQVHALAIRIDSEGNVLWQRVYRIAGDDTFHAVRVLDSGELIVAGETHTTHSVMKRAWLLRLDQDGEVVWHREYPAASSKGAAFSNIWVSSSGEIVAAGEYQSSPFENTRGWLVGADSTNGALLWQRSHGAGGIDDLAALTCTDVSGCVSTGWSTSFGGPPSGDADSYLIRTDEFGSVDASCTYEEVSSVSDDFGPLVADPFPGVTSSLEGFTATSFEIAAVEMTLTPDESCSGGPLYPPTEVSPSESLTPLTIADTSSLAWEEAPASASESFDLYRGDVSDLSAGWTGSCLMASIAESAASDSQTPSPGVAWFYIVGGFNSFGSGILGSSSAGDTRTPLVPCEPTQ